MVLASKLLPELEEQLKWTKIVMDDEVRMVDTPIDIFLSANFYNLINNQQVGQTPHFLAFTTHRKKFFCRNLWDLSSSEILVNLEWSTKPESWPFVVTNIFMALLVWVGVLAPAGWPEPYGSAHSGDLKRPITKTQSCVVCSRVRDL